jgi:hypothetical protein
MNTAALLEDEWPEPDGEKAKTLRNRCLSVLAGVQITTVGELRGKTAHEVAAIRGMGPGPAAVVARRFGPLAVTR